MYAKKSLGQNFLKSNAIVKTIVSAGNIAEDNLILEIGPGKGILTKQILIRGATVIAVEKDARLIQYLKEIFSKEIQSGKLILIYGDILEIFPNIPNLKQPYKAIANIPYYISGALIKKLLGGNCQPTQIVFLLQKEVAKRIVANDGKESILSISVKSYGNPKYIQTVKKELFSPKPKVDSAILSIENISKDFFANLSEEKYFNVVKTAFGQKRKMLKKTLNSYSDSIESILSTCKIPKLSRPENLSLKEWWCLSRHLSLPDQ